MGESNSNENQHQPKRKSKKCRPMIRKVTLGSFSSDDLRRRTTSLMWEAEHDPFQVFEIEHDSCLDLEVEITKGEDITKGSYVGDLCDTPDPYVVLKVPGSSNSSKRTSHIDNTVNPIWNETFHFYLDPKKQHVLHIVLMDANFILNDDFLGENILDVNSLLLDTPAKHVVQFVGGSKVHMTVKLQKNKNHDLRFSLALCEEEKEFLRLRRENVRLNMQKILGDRGPKYKEEVPVVAVLGSGGGFRAMICLSGVIKALHQTGLLGCATYLSGLSGSSWLISTLYAHDKFPNLTYDEVYEELLKSVTHNWKWNLVHFHRYCLDLIKKYQGGQPVSFTDIFGHLLSDVLLQGKNTKKLSDQRAIVKQGIVPLPLYTCLHAKAAVSCKAFSEWIEFSPFEIGIAKYGTFMKTEDFGSKFIVGKLVRKYPEFPLHYLQGVWGSAFTILIKRLVLQGGPKQDIVQMMREEQEERELNEKLEEEYLAHEDSSNEKESETDDESDIQGADDKTFEDENKENNHITRSHENDVVDRSENRNCFSHLENVKEVNANVKEEESDESKVSANGTDVKNKRNIFSFVFNKPRSSEDNHRCKLEKFISMENCNAKSGLKLLPKKSSSFEFPLLHEHGFSRSDSKDDARSRKQSTESDPGIGSQLLAANKEARKRTGIRRQGAIRDVSPRSVKHNVTNPKGNTNKYWEDRRKERRTMRERKSSIIQELLKNSNLLNSRVGRAGEILNPFRGLSLKQSFPLSPFSNLSEDETEENGDETQDTEFGLGCRYEALDHTAKKLFVVDSGLAFNSPYPVLLRPQRAVDIYLSFDFSQRPSDRHMPFKELILAEKWANQNKVPFPPIAKQAEEFSKECYVRELYIFKDENDPYCPVILHFTIVNYSFKWEKAPGVPRVTKEEFDFADFSLFDDPTQPFASTNFLYEPLQYDRLVKLTEYNTLLNVDTIKEEFTKMVEIKRKLALETLEYTFYKMQKVMDACKRFKKDDSIRLKIDGKETRKLMNTLRCSKNLLKTQLSSSYEDNACSFFDASDHLDSHDEESEYETDEGESQTLSQTDGIECSKPTDIDCRNKTKTKES